MTKTRPAHIMIVMTAFVAGLAIFLAAFLYATGQFGGGNGAPGPSAIGGPFKLTDQNGKAVSDADMKGRPFLVFFGYTHCPDICPTTLFEVSEVLHALGPDANRTGALFITVDPERDTRRGDEGLSVELRPASARAHRRAARHRGGGEGLPGLCQESCRPRTATTAWTIPRWSI